MPTNRRRYTITETAPVQDALDALRRAGIDPNLPQLVILGAGVALNDVSLAEQEEARKRASRRELIADARAGRHGVDIDSALAGNRPAWDR